MAYAEVNSPRNSHALEVVAENESSAQTFRLSKEVVLGGVTFPLTLGTFCEMVNVEGKC